MALKIPDITVDLIKAALSGELNAVDAILKVIQPAIFNLSIRMLGNRDDAADATQEILLKVITRLDSFRGEAAFGTWVFQVARHHLLNALTRNKEAPAISLESLAEKLQLGLDIGAALASQGQGERSLTPEDKAEALEIALNCTQGMLMALDRGHRLAYLLDTIFGLSANHAAQVLEITPVAYRKRLSRARQAMDDFVNRSCGLANPGCACRCEKQSPALALQRQRDAPLQQQRLRMIRGEEADHVEREFNAIRRMSDSASLFRAHPDYQTPNRVIAAIRAVLAREGWIETAQTPSRPH